MLTCRHEITPCNQSDHRLSSSHIRSCDGGIWHRTECTKEGPYGPVRLRPSRSRGRWTTPGVVDRQIDSRSEVMARGPPACERPLPAPTGKGLAESCELVTTSVNSLEQYRCLPRLSTQIYTLSTQIYTCGTGAAGNRYLWYWIDLLLARLRDCSATCTQRMTTEGEMITEKEQAITRCLLAMCVVTGLALIVQAPMPVTALLAYGATALASWLTRR